MSKLKEFFQFIYKEFYDSDIGYLITTTIYLIICFTIVVYAIPKDIPSFGLATVVSIALLISMGFLLLPVFFVISLLYAAINALILKIKFILKG